MAVIQIKDFKGLAMNEGLWNQGFAKYTIGADINGLSRGNTRITYPGVIEGFLQVSAGSQSTSAASAVDSIPVAFSTFLGNDYTITQTGRLLRREQSTSAWTKVSAITVSSTPSNPDLMVYGANLYYSELAYLGRYDNTNGNANFQTLTDGTTSSPRPMRILNGTLYVGDGRYVASYDGTIFTGARLTLPSNFIIKSMEVIGDLLYIMADDTFKSSLFIWDGTSTTYRTNISIADEQSAPILKAVGNTLYAVGNSNSVHSGTPIYVFNGYSFDKISTLPILRDPLQINGLLEFSGGLLIGSEEGATARYEDGVGGIWYIGRNNNSSQLNTTMAFPFRGDPIKKAPGAIGFGGAGRIYMGVQDSTTSTYEIFEVDQSQTNQNTTVIWQSLPIDAGSTNRKMWSAIKINAESFSAGHTVVIKYRLDDTSSFTTLKTLTTSSDLKANIPIGKTSRTIDIRLELTRSSAGTLTTTRVHSFELEYTLTQNG